MLRSKTRLKRIQYIIIKLSKMITDLKHLSPLLLIRMAISKYVCNCSNRMDPDLLFKQRMNHEWMNEWMKHLYSALLCIVVHPKHFTIIWGGLSSTTTMACLKQDGTELVCKELFITELIFGATASNTSFSSVVGITSIEQVVDLKLDTMFNNSR